MAKKTTPVKELLIQNNFITKLKEILPANVGLAEEIADVLNISIDSAYRRIRGETELTIEEVYKLTKKYVISVDDVFSNRSDTVTFSYTKLIDSSENLENYFNRISGHLKLITQFDNKKLHYVAEETPLFYSFFSKKNAEFKLFYWQRSVLNVPEYQNKKFEWGIIPDRLIEVAHQSFLEYLKVPSVEIWTRETILTNLRQIQFYLDSGILKKEQALELLEENRDMLTMVQGFAENGRKNISDKNETFQLYSSEVVLGTNCIYVQMGESRYSYITFNTLNSLTTNNPEFCEETEHWMKNLEKKSTLISGIAEKQRYQFFSDMFKTLDQYVNLAKL
ncbi:MAG: hypothetical protein IPM51_14675 [Sphingobacteriaceae bacterium]|nr:hypothetical protein [Sphingobacteriaceae bacterium]